MQTRNKTSLAARLAWVERLPEANEILRCHRRAAELDAEIAAEQERHRRRLAELRAEAKRNAHEAEAMARRHWTGAEIEAAQVDPAAPPPVNGPAVAAPPASAPGPGHAEATTAAAPPDTRSPPTVDRVWLAECVIGRRARAYDALTRDPVGGGATAIAGEIAGLDYVLGLLGVAPPSPPRPRHGHNAPEVQCPT